MRAFGILSGKAAYRGFLGFYNSDNLTYAASIAYYALVSLFPFSMLAFAVLGTATADDDNRRVRARGGYRCFGHLEEDRQIRHAEGRLIEQDLAAGELESVIDTAQ